MRLVMRLRQAWAVLTGRVRLPTTIEGLVFMTALAKTDAALATLQTAATALINSHETTTAGAAATAKALSDADDAVSAQLDGITSQINAVLPNVTGTAQTTDAPELIPAPEVTGTNDAVQPTA